MHDLVRLYSAHHGDTRASVDDRGEALTRLLEYYLVTTHAANAHLDPKVTDPAALGFGDRQQALAWLDIEYPNLTAATHAVATEHDLLTSACDLPDAMAEFLEWRRHFKDWIVLSNVALTVAHTLGDHHGRAIALNNLGMALRHTRRFEEAITAHQRAVRISRDVGDHHGEGNALGNLGIALQEMRRFEEAITTHQDAVQIYTDTGDQHGAGRALNNLGSALLEVRQFEEAVTVYQHAARIFHDTGDRYGEGIALNNLESVRQAQLQTTESEPK
jgi:tetratricopeptide (TPR) repeat protein